MKSFFSNKKHADQLVAVIGAIAMAIILLWAPGAQAQSGNVYDGYQTQLAGTVYTGVILQVSQKEVAASTSSRAGGAGIGAILGGAVGGNNASDNNKLTGQILGATVGGILGDVFAQKATKNVAQELIVMVTNPETGRSKAIVLIQPAPFEELMVDDKVLVIATQDKIRVIRRGFDENKIAKNNSGAMP